MTDPSPLQYPIVQISLDLTNLADALEMAEIAVSAGVDWLEAGTPLLLGEGLRAVEALHTRFPKHPIVADLKTMDGGYLEAEMMAKAGASFVVVMGRAHEATVRRVVAERGQALRIELKRGYSFEDPLLPRGVGNRDTSANRQSQRYQ